MKFNFNKTSELFNSLKDLDIKMVDLRFTDLPGTTQHFTIPINSLNEDVFVEGLGFDGSSVRGFQEIQESDMIVVPDVSSSLSNKTTSIHPYFAR